MELDGAPGLGSALLAGPGVAPGAGVSSRSPSNEKGTPAFLCTMLSARPMSLSQGGRASRARAVPSSAGHCVLTYPRAGLA